MTLRTRAAQAGARNKTSGWHVPYKPRSIPIVNAKQSVPDECPHPLSARVCTGAGAMGWRFRSSDAFSPVFFLPAVAKTKVPFWQVEAVFKLLQMFRMFISICMVWMSADNANRGNNE